MATRTTAAPEPWSRWQGNPESRITLIGNNYGESSPHRASHGLPALEAPSNAHLVYLFNLIGIPIPPPPRNEAETTAFPYGRHSLLFFTNAYLRDKAAGDFSSRLRCEIKSPLLIVAGAKAYGAASKAVGTGKTFCEALGALLPTSRDGQWMYTVLHPSAPTRWEEHVQQWLGLRDFLYAEPRLSDVREWLINESSRFQQFFHFPRNCPKRCCQQQ